MYSSNTSFSLLSNGNIFNLKKNYIKLEKLVRTYFIFIIASISTEISSGKAMDPTATLVCFPLSPKIFTSRSDAPLIIIG